MESIEEVSSNGTDIVAKKVRDEQLRELLSTNAYTAKEVAIKLDVTPTGASIKLNRWVEKGFAERKLYNGSYHYYIRNK